MNFRQSIWMLTDNFFYYPQNNSIWSIIIDIGSCVQIFGCIIKHNGLWIHIDESDICTVIKTTGSASNLKWSILVFSCNLTHLNELSGMNKLWIKALYANKIQHLPPYQAHSITLHRIPLQINAQKGDIFMSHLYAYKMIYHLGQKLKWSSFFFMRVAMS